MVSLTLARACAILWINPEESDRIHPRLREYLMHINMQAERAGGELLSRIVIALAIQVWSDNHPDEQVVVD